MIRMDSRLDPKLAKEIDEQIDHFLDEFMNEEYKGRDHIVAREHYSKVFHEILPVYMQLSALILCKSISTAETGEVLK
jgi:hypothetical protein